MRHWTNAYALASTALCGLSIGCSQHHAALDEDPPGRDEGPPGVDDVPPTEVPAREPDTAPLACDVLANEVVANHPGLCDPPSIALDGGGAPHLAWADASYTGHHARRMGEGSWELTNPTGTDRVRSRMGLALDSEGTPFITARDATVSYAPYRSALYVGSSGEARQAFDSYRVSIAMGEDGVLHGLASTVRSDGFTRVGGLVYLRGDASTLTDDVQNGTVLSETLVVEEEGYSLGGTLILHEGAPTILYTAAAGLFLQTGSEPAEHLVLPDAGSLQNVAVYGLLEHRSDEPTPLRILRTGRDGERNEVGVVSIRSGPDGAWRSRLFHMLPDDPPTADADAASCPTEAPAVGDRCSVDQLAGVDLVAKYAATDGVWLLQEMTRRQGELTYTPSCEETYPEGPYEGDGPAYPGPCGWVSDLEESHSLIVRKIVDDESVDGEPAEQGPTTVLDLAVPDPIDSGDATLGADGTLHAVLAERHRVDTQHDCAVRYLALRCGT